jgi:hypothetical protein
MQQQKEHDKAKCAKACVELKMTPQPAPSTNGLLAKSEQLPEKSNILWQRIMPVSAQPTIRSFSQAKAAIDPSTQPEALSKPKISTTRESISTREILHGSSPQLHPANVCMQKSAATDRQRLPAISSEIFHPQSHTNPSIPVPVEVKDLETITAIAPKPKPTARSRELAMLLENISNLAPEFSSDTDSSDHACHSSQRVSKSSENGQSHNRLSAPQASSAFEPCSRTQPQQQCDPSHNVVSYRDQVGGFVDLSVTGATGLVYGDIVYADDSCLAAAAVHAGMLSVGETKSVRLYILGPHKGFVSSLRNGIKSHSYPKWPGSFAFAPDAREQATAAGAERKRVLQERRAAKKTGKNAPASSNEIACGNGSSQSCSSSDSEAAAAHLEIPAVAVHLQALAENGTSHMNVKEYWRST